MSPSITDDVFLHVLLIWVCKQLIFGLTLTTRALWKFFVLYLKFRPQLLNLQIKRSLMVIAGVSWMFIFQDTTLRNKVFLHQSLSSFTLFKNAEMT